MPAATLVSVYVSPALTVEFNFAYVVELDGERYTLYPLIVPDPPTGEGATQASVTLCAVPAGATSARKRKHRRATQKPAIVQIHFDTNADRICTSLDSSLKWRTLQLARF